MFKDLEVEVMAKQKISKLTQKGSVMEYTM